MTEPKYFDQIEDYLTGRLSDIEARAFERRASGDEGLRTELELQRLEHDSMELMLEKDLKANMATWGGQPPPNPFEDGDGTASRTPKRGLRWLPLALLGALALAGAWWFLGNTGAADKNEPLPSTEQNHLQKAKEQPAPPANIPIAEETPAANGEDEAPPTQKAPPQRPAPPPQSADYLSLAATMYGTPPTFASGLKSGEATDGKSAHAKAAEAFDKGEYAKALQLLGPPQTEDQSTVRYLRGHTYYMMKKYGAASREFAAVASDEFLPNYQEAQWYLLLSYLARLPDTKKEFDDLAGQLSEDEYSDYREKAKALLKAMD